MEVSTLRRKASSKGSFVGGKGGGAKKAMATGFRNKCTLSTEPCVEQRIIPDSTLRRLTWRESQMRAEYIDWIEEASKALEQGPIKLEFLELAVVA